MREYSEYKWNGYQLNYGNEYEGWSLIPHEIYEGMWYILTPKGVTNDFYNLQRAKDNAVKLNQYEYNLKYRQKPSEAPSVRLNRKDIPTYQREGKTAV